MSLTYIIFLALGVSLDSFAISVCRGIGETRPFKTSVVCAISFSFFQLSMSVAGYFLGQACESFTNKFNHYIVFAVLFLFGINMFKEAFSKDKQSQKNTIWSIVLIAFLSSFDSLGVGISLAVFDANLFLTATFICIFTIFLSFAGIYIGKYFGRKHKKIACILGGIILIILSIKMLCDHLF